LRFDHPQRVALGALSGVVAILAILPRRTIALDAALAVVTLVARLTIVLIAILPRPVIAWPVVPGTIIARPVVALAVFALLTVVTLTVITGAVVPLPIFTLRAVVALTELTARAVVALLALALLAVFALLTLALPLVVALPAAIVAALAIGFDGFRLASLFDVQALILEVDVIAGDELVSADDLAQRSQRLHGAKNPEVVLGVLQVVLRQHPISGRSGVTRQLLVLFVDVLGSAADFDVVRPVGIECAVGIVLRLAAAAPITAATAAATAVALTLHPLEISHI
jgi:hypothetical protein